jgi:putative peptidoglycan lipid II flippase
VEPWNTSSWHAGLMLIDRHDSASEDEPSGESAADLELLATLIPARRGPVQGPSIDGAWAAYADQLPAPEPASNPGQVAEPRTSAARASRIMAMGTMASRITGLIRSLLLASALGLGVMGSAFNTANNLPNTISALIVGGAISSLFVPQLVRAAKEDADGGQRYRDLLLTLSIIILGATTVACVVFAPQIVSLYAGGYTGADRTVTITLTRYCAPQIFCYGMFVILGQVLNSKDRFGPMTWTPVLANLVMIATLGGFMWATAGRRISTESVSPAELRLLGLGTTLGIVLQTIALLPYLRKVGVGYRPRLDPRGAGLRKSATLAKWTVAAVLVAQAGAWLMTRYGNDMDVHFRNQGVGYAAYTNAWNIWILPQAVVSVSLVTALLPRMSRAAQAGDPAAVRASISFGLRMAGVAIVPCAFAFLAFGQQICALLFGHGNTDEVMVRNTGFLLMALALGLIPFSAQYVMVRGFYAYEDSRTPFMVTTLGTAINAALTVAAYYALRSTPWAMAAMCVASVIASSVSMVITGLRLRRKLPGFESRRIVRTHLKLGTASLLAAALGAPLTIVVVRALGHAAIGESTALLAGGGVFAIAFLLAARRLRIHEVTTLVGVARTRLGW